MAVLAENVLLVETDRSPRQQLIKLFDRFEAPLCGYLGAILTDPDAVFDCAQDTFVRAYEHLVQGKQVNSQWLYTVARNRAIDHIRHRGRVGGDIEFLAQAEWQSEQPSEREARTKQVLNALPVADRELLYLSIVDRFPTDEIASMLGIRSGAARVRLFRARERFRVLYGEMS